MFIALALIVGGLVVLAFGADVLVRGASSLALLARIRASIVGLTVVAAGTSLPELVVSMKSALVGSPDLALGNVVGSNIFNLTVVLGFAALLRPLRVLASTVRMEAPVMVLAAFQLHLLARDGLIDRPEGAFLTMGWLLFVVYMVHVAKRESGLAEEQEFADELRPPVGQGLRGWLLSLGWVALGVLLLVGGSEALVRGAVSIARLAGVSERVVGLTIVAAGTSLPELATSAVASWRGHDDIAVANVVGSNIFNSLAIVGLTSVVHPLGVNPLLVMRDNPWMLVLSVLVVPLFRAGMRVNRIEGALLVASFVAYLTLLL